MSAHKNKNGRFSPERPLAGRYYRHVNRIKKKRVEKWENLVALQGLVHTGLGLFGLSTVKPIAFRSGRFVLKSDFRGIC